MDFVHGSTRHGRAFKYLVVIDEFTRECLTLDVGRSITSDRVLDTLVEPDLLIQEWVRAVVDELERVQLLQQRRAERGRLIIAKREVRRRFAGLDIDENGVRVARPELMLARGNRLWGAVDFEDVRSFARLG